MRFTKLSMAVFFMIVFAGMADAQLMFGVQGGIGGSAYEDQEEGATGVPLGVFAGTNALPLFDIGIEYNMLMSPYKFEGDLYSSEFNQNYLGAFVRWYLLPLQVVDIYAKAGAAYYTGKVKIEGGGESYEGEFKNTLGFNIGAGVKTMVGIYGEFVYHIFSSEVDYDSPDLEDAKKAGYNNWMLMVGYQFEL